MTKTRRHVIGLERQRGGIVSNGLLQVLGGARGVLGRIGGANDRGKLARAGRIGRQFWLVLFGLCSREFIDLERKRHGVEPRQVDDSLDVRGVGLQLALEVGDQPVGRHLPGLDPHVDGRHLRGGHQEGESSGGKRTATHQWHLVLSSASQSVS